MVFLHTQSITENAEQVKVRNRDGQKTRAPVQAVSLRFSDPITNRLPYLSWPVWDDN